MDINNDLSLTFIPSRIYSVSVAVGQIRGREGDINIDDF
jgi:hypothetical protein